MGLLVRVARWIGHRWRPTGGWGLWTVTLVVALWPAWTLGQTGWLRESTLPLVETALFAALIAWWLISHVKRRGLRALLMAITFYPVVLTTIARAWPPLRLLVDATVHTITWVLSLGAVGEPARAWSVWGEVLALRVLVFHGELVTWLSALTGGQVASGRTALFTLFALLLYAYTCWLVWAVRVHHDGGWAMLPGLFIVGWNVYWAGEGAGWLAGMLALGVLLSVLTRYAHLEMTWIRRRLDFSDQLWLDFAAVGLGGALAAATVVLLVTAVTSPHLYTRVQGFLARPWARVERETTRLFPDVARPARSPLGRSTVPTMPRARKLGASPQLLDTLVMTVRPKGGPLPPRAYFFALAYDVYTGSGWMQSPWQVEGLAPGEEWRGPVGQERFLVELTVEMQQPTRDVYAAAIPVAVDRPADALTFAGKDLLGLRLRDGVRDYTVLGAISAVDEARLRLTSTAYPPWITNHYLQVPESVPPRVRQLAQEITRDAYSPYDKARAIEAYLRQIPYSLDVSTPPPDRDVVDWFLFDLRRGYCDYYATAFVVLARLSGLPARLAIGYAQGQWDSTAGLYKITEREAHSWPEVYFPPYGWVPFEPTAIRQVFQWPKTQPTWTARSPATWRETLAAFRHWASARWRVSLLSRVGRMVMALLGGALAVVLAWWAYWWWRVPRPARPYAQLTWLAERLGVHWQAGWTPREFGEATKARVKTLPVPPTWQKRLAARTDWAIETYMRWRFGSPPEHSPTANRESSATASPA